MPKTKRNKKVPSNHWSNVSEEDYDLSQYSQNNNVFLSPKNNSISSKLEKVSLSDFPRLNREIFKINKKSKKLNVPLTYANITKKNLQKHNNLNQIYSKIYSISNTNICPNDQKESSYS